MKAMKIAFYWMVMNITESVFEWAREKWVKENSYILWRNRYSSNWRKSPRSSYIH